MDVFPKFIIEDDCLIMARVSYHKDLVINKDKVKGGGWFKYSQDSNTVVFHGDSHDFGKARLEDIQKCVASGNVYSSPTKTNQIAGKHNFAYDTDSEIINIIK